MTAGETEGAQPLWFSGGGHETPAGQRLATLLERPGILGVPGAHDGLSGLLARKAGFECLYVSGAALSADLALPDVGLTTLSEVALSPPKATPVERLVEIILGNLIWIAVGVFGGIVLAVAIGTFFGQAGRRTQLEW